MTASQNFPHNAVEQPTAEAGLPWTGLLALAMAGFITILTEALPAGLMPQMGRSLQVSEALVGQLVTLYAFGSLLAAIPLTLLTQGWRRRPLLMIAIGGFAVVNTVTALSSWYPLTLVARFFAGVFAGLVWALLAGYAARMVAAPLKGRAIAVAMVGTPLALTLGIPAGTLLGTHAGWQTTFICMSVMTVALLLWVRVKVPDFAGQPPSEAFSLGAVWRIAGVKAVLLATLGFVLAHNILYTYITPLLVPSGLNTQIGIVLLVFGASALAGITVIGMLIDRWLRELTLATTLMFIAASLALALWSQSAAVVYALTVIWGLAFGGAATLLQTACAKVGERAADVSQAMLVTTWNLGIAGGGVVGGALLQGQGSHSLPWVAAVLLAVVWVTVLLARRAGFKSAMSGH